MAEWIAHDGHAVTVRLIGRGAELRRARHRRARANAASQSGTVRLRATVEPPRSRGERTSISGYASDSWMRAAPIRSSA